MNDILEGYALNVDLTLGLHSKGALVTGTASGSGSKTVELLAGHGVHAVTDDSNSTVMEMEREGQIAALVESMAEILLFPWKRPSLPPLSSWLGDFHRRTLYRPQRSERRFLRVGQASNTGDVHPLVEPVSHHVHALACPYIPADNCSVLTSAHHHTPIGAKDHCPYPARMTV